MRTVRCSVVSIRAPVRGATCSSCWPSYTRRCFDPRSRAGSDLNRSEMLRRLSGVSIRAPVRGATSEHAWRLKHTTFRSALPCGERPEVSAYLDKIEAVSIRAPVRGATWSECATGTSTACFDPRSRAGSDFISRRTQEPLRCFDPRSRAGSDMLPKPTLPRPMQFRSALPCGERLRARSRHGHDRGVSIRAPVRGATLARRPTSQSSRGFDPRSRAGSDLVALVPITFSGVSIRAPVRGATKAACEEMLAAMVSIRAPVRGATGGAVPIREFLMVSIRAPVRGATGIGRQTARDRLVSIRAPVRGATFGAGEDLEGAKFQSALPCGERPAGPWVW